MRIFSRTFSKKCFQKCLQKCFNNVPFRNFRFFWLVPSWQRGLWVCCRFPWQGKRHRTGCRWDRQWIRLRAVRVILEYRGECRRGRGCRRLKSLFGVSGMVATVVFFRVVIFVFIYFLQTFFTFFVFGKFFFGRF